MDSTSTLQWLKDEETDSNNFVGRRLEMSRQRRDQPLSCPRCNSTNTKFCYYNNYSLSQPRHFCKGCRRFWTQGGSLRNVPVGGGTRKSKINSSSSVSSSTFKKITNDQHYLMGPPPSLLINPSSFRAHNSTKMNSRQTHDVNQSYRSASHNCQDQSLANLTKFIEAPFIPIISEVADTKRQGLVAQKPNICSPSTHLLNAGCSVIDSTGLNMGSFPSILISENEKGSSYSSGFRLQGFKPSSSLNFLQGGFHRSGHTSFSGAADRHDQLKDNGEQDKEEGFCK